MAAPNLFTNQRYGASIAILTVIIGLLLCFTPAALAQQLADSKGERPELVLQIGHRSFIYHVAVSLDGKTAASISFDRTLKLWDAQSGDLMHTVLVPEASWDKMRFSADGKTIEADYMLRNTLDHETRRAVHDLQTRELKLGLDASSSPCPDKTKLVVAVPDKKVAVCSQENRAGISSEYDFFLWDTQTKQKAHITKSSSVYDLHLEFSPDGRTIAISQSRERGVVFWDVTTRQAKRRWNDRSFRSFSPDGQTIVLQIPEADRCACPEDNKLPLSDKAKLGAVELWDAQLKAPRRTLIGREFFGYSPDGRTILLKKRSETATAATLELWDTQLEAIKQTLPGEIGDFSERLFSSDGRMMALGSYNSAEEIILYDLQAGKIANRLLTGSIPFDGFAFSRDGATLASLSWSGEAKLWDAHTGALKASLKFPKQGSAESTELTLSMMKVAISADCQMVVSGGQNGAVVMWNFRAGRVTLPVASNSHGITPGFSSAGQKLLHWQSTPPGAPDIPVMAWNLDTLQAQPLPPGNAEKLLEESKPTLSPDGRLSAKLSGDSKSVTLYDAQTGKQLRTFNGHTSAISAVIFAPDSRTMATVSGLPALDVLLKVMLALADVPDGDQKPDLKAELRKLSGDGTIKLWDVQTGQLKQTLQCDGAIHQACFLPDGSAIIATHSKATS